MLMDCGTKRSWESMKENFNLGAVMKNNFVHLVGAVSLVLQS